MWNAFSLPFSFTLMYIQTSTFNIVQNNINNRDFRLGFGYGVGDVWLWVVPFLSRMHSPHTSKLAYLLATSAQGPTFLSLNSLNCSRKASSGVRGDLRLAPSAKECTNNGIGEDERNARARGKLSREWREVVRGLCKLGE